MSFFTKKKAPAAIGQQEGEGFDQKHAKMDHKKIVYTSGRKG